MTRMNFSKINATLLGLSLFLPIAFSQQPEVMRELLFSVYSLQRPGGLHFAGADGEPRPVRFYSSSASPFYEYKGPPALNFFRLVEQATDELPMRKSVASTEIGPELKEALLVFFPNTGNDADGLRIYPLDLNPTRFPLETMIIFNLSGRDLFGSVSGVTFATSTGVTEPFPARGAVPVRIGTSFGERIGIVMNTPIQVPPRSRAVLFLLPPFVANTVEIQHRLIIIPDRGEIADETADAP